nr:MAG TPA: hypothetical protein [Caudoviricetes sp.]
MWAVKNKLGTVLFVTNCERTANNRREMGWIVEEVKMTSREQFEKWICDGVNSDVHRGIMLSRYENGNYIHLATKHKWDAWQASRAAIEIELPDVYGDKYTPSSCTMDGFDFENYLHDLYVAIEQENIKVKK